MKSPEKSYGMIGFCYESKKLHEIIEDLGSKFPKIMRLILIFWFLISRFIQNKYLPHTGFARVREGSLLFLKQNYQLKRLHALKNDKKIQSGVLGFCGLGFSGFKRIRKKDVEYTLNFEGLKYLRSQYFHSEAEGRGREINIYHLKANSWWGAEHLNDMLSSKKDVANGSCRERSKNSED